MKVELKNVSKRLNDVTVLEDISLTLESGTIYGLKGKNGCGKTMLMRMMAGLIYPTSGTVSIDGEILHKDIATVGRPDRESGQNPNCENYEPCRA